MKDPIIAVDLFCGAGGTSTGLMLAARDAGVCVQLLAINHWDVAVDTHLLNHPNVRHLCETLDSVDPRKLFPDGKLDLLLASPECFPAGTLVLTSRGNIPIEDIAVGDSVLTHHGRWRRVTATMENLQPTVIVRGHGHPGLETTPEHPFYSGARTRKWRNDVRQYRWSYDVGHWTAAKDLHTPGDIGRLWASPVVAEPLRIPPVGGRGMKFSPDFWWMVGRWLGDGNLRIRENKNPAPRRSRRPARQWPATCEECGQPAERNGRYPHLANFYCGDRCKSKAEGRTNLFRGSSVQICCSHAEAQELESKLAFSPPAGVRATTNELRWSRREMRTATLFDCPHHGLASWLIEHFGQHASGKTLPAWVLGMPEADRRALLEGYLAADGWADHRKCEASTVSKRLAVGIRLLAESLGYRVALHSVPAKSMQIEGRTVNCRSQWHLVWVDKPRREYYHADGLHSWSPVVSVMPGRQAVQVYNLSVEEDESYVADGIVVHNCVHHSLARGGRPMSDQSRATAWHILRWAEALRPRSILIENVREFRSWGPLNDHGRPIKSKQGALYRQFLASLRALGYSVDARLLNACHYGDPTSRVRLFIQARLGRGPVTWPVQSHAPIDELELMPGTRPYRTARQIIDWSIPGKSIYERKRPLADNTMRRIYAGLRKFSGLPFVVHTTHTGGDRVASLDQPLATITTAHRGEQALVEPFVIGQQSCAAPRSVDEPLPTVATAGAISLIQPYLVGAGGPTGQADPRSVDEPLGTILADDHRALCQPFLVVFRTDQDAASTDGPASELCSLVEPFLLPHRYGSSSPDKVQSVDTPLPTITTASSVISLVDPYIVSYHSEKPGDSARVGSIDQPVPTVDCANRHAVAEPYIVPFFGERDGQEPRSHSVDVPLPTVTSHGAGALVQPYLVNYYGNGGPMSVDEPLDTVTTRDRFALVSPEMVPHLSGGRVIGYLDIRFRMLQPHELSAAMGFPADYQFTGTRDDKVRQIGNAVPVGVATALCFEILQSGIGGNARRAEKGQWTR